VRVRDPERAKGVSVDPYGWRGEGRDPRVVRGRPANVWLWKEGEAPPLVRAVRAKTPPDPVAPVRLVAVDGVQPLAGEYVDLGATPDLRRPIKLKGWSLRNEGGEVVPLPTVRIPPGEELRVWTSRPDPGEGEISLDRSAPLWEDNRDCAALLDPQGQIVGALPHGRRNKQCTGWGG
jgi:hypothetical protein